jgi:hypothetical protein
MLLRAERRKQRLRQETLSVVTLRAVVPVVVMAKSVKEEITQKEESSNVIT